MYMYIYIYIYIYTGQRRDPRAGPPARACAGGTRRGSACKKSLLCRVWAVTFTPTAVPKTVCVTFSEKKWVQ